MFIKIEFGIKRYEKLAKIHISSNKPFVLLFRLKHYMLIDKIILVTELWG